jgi:hypothetical protein
MSDVLRPFLENWQIDYRHWWYSESNPRLPPPSSTTRFPTIGRALIRLGCAVRKLQDELITIYKLVDVGSSVLRYPCAL